MVIVPGMDIVDVEGTAPDSSTVVEEVELTNGLWPPAAP